MTVIRKDINKIIPWLVFCVIALLLLACSRQTKDYHYYRLHPKALLAAQQRCSKDEKQATLPSQRCQIVLAAYVDTQTMLRQVRSMPFVFGMTLLKNQMQLAALQQQLAALTEKIKDNQDENSEDQQQILDLMNRITDLQNQIHYQLKTIAMLDTY